jgi:predicted nucleic acid-binding protein
MSLADACVVRMSELHNRAKVWTTDSDFTIYRRHRRSLIPLITPSR